MRRNRSNSDEDDMVNGKHWLTTIVSKLRHNKRNVMLLDILRQYIVSEELTGEHKYTCT